MMMIECLIVLISVVSYSFSIEDKILHVFELAHKLAHRIHEIIHKNTISAVFKILTSMNTGQLTSWQPILIAIFESLLHSRFNIKPK